MIGAADKTQYPQEVRYDPRCAGHSSYQRSVSFKANIASYNLTYTCPHCGKGMSGQSWQAYQTDEWAWKGMAAKESPTRRNARTWIGRYSHCRNFFVYATEMGRLGDMGCDA